MEADFYVETLDEALARYGPPGIMNTDQGSQFTRWAWTSRLQKTGRPHPDGGKGRFTGNISVERLWRSLKYECVYRHAWSGGREARASIGDWVRLYNQRRPYAALGGRTPDLALPPQADQADAQSCLNQPRSRPTDGDHLKAC